MASITVLMAVHNGAEFLTQSVASILNQTLSDFEFIIINDGSTDGSADVVGAFHDSRIILLTNSQRIGLTASLNRGLSRAKGVYIARMDADDVSLPRRLELQAAYLDAHPEVGVLGSAIRGLDANNSVGSIERPVAQSHAVIRWFQCYSSPFTHSAVMMRRDALLRVGGYNPEFQTAQDRDLWQRLDAVTRLANLPDVLLYLRRHEASISAVHRVEQKRNAAKVGQRMMSTILGEEVPYEICLSIELGSFPTAREALQASQIVKQLYRVFMSDQLLSWDERRAIRLDTSRRLYYFARFWPDDPDMRRVFLQACRLNPSLAVRATLGRPYRALRRSLP